MIRKTDYCTILKEVEVILDPSYTVLVQVIQVKGSTEEELRFAYKKNGSFVPRPVDINFFQWILVLEKAIKNNIFPIEFLKALKTILERKGV